MTAPAYLVTSVAELRSQIQREYLELPGLTLTLPQAVRMWNAERGACAAALGALVESGFLYRVGQTFRRVDCRRRCA